MFPVILPLTPIITYTNLLMPPETWPSKMESYLWRIAVVTLLSSRRVGDDSDDCDDVCLFNLFFIKLWEVCAWE